jgi:serine/threonine protein phosphatase PrpC
MLMSAKIFCCYAHEDEALLNKLKAHLRPLQRQGLIDVWHDQDISAGTEREQAINEQLNEAQIILLLVSPDFLASDYLFDIEVKHALERHERQEVHVIPIILRPVAWDETPFGKFQALPSEGKPVTSWLNLDEAFLDIARGIQKVVKVRFDVTDSSTLFQSSSSVQQMELEITSAYTEKDWLAVIRKAELLIKQLPESVTAEIYRMQGLAFLEEDEKEQAINAFETALALLNDQKRRLAFLDEYVIQLAKQDQWSHVLQYASEALRLMPVKNQRLRWMRKPNLQYASEALRLKPDVITWLVRKAQALYQLGQTEESLSIYKNATRISNQDSILSTHEDHIYLVEASFPAISYLLAAGASDVGKERELNEDSILILLPSFGNEWRTEASGAYIVVDGMGGLGAGDVASRLVINVFEEHMKRELFNELPDQPTIALHEQRTIKIPDQPTVKIEGNTTQFDMLGQFKVEQILKKSIIDANRKMLQYGDRVSSARGLGATVNGFVVVGDKAYIFNVGDSRTYIGRDRQLHKVTKDHSLVQRLVEANQIEPEDVYTHQHRNLIYRSLGAGHKQVDLDIFIETLRPGDILLCCSDGLWEMLRDPQLADILYKAPDPHTACRQLVDTANDNGGEDNISVIVVFVR